MSQFDNKKAAALKYEGTNRAPVIVASGSGYVAEKIVEVAQENKVPIYQDNSLITLLSQLQVGSEIPQELYQAIVDIYVYFLNYKSADEVEEIEEVYSHSEEEKQEIDLSTEEPKEEAIAVPKQGQHIDISVAD